MDSVSTGPHGAPFGFERLWQSRLAEDRPRRGSTLSEGVAGRPAEAPSRRGSHLSEEVDWIGSTSGDEVSGDEVSDGGHDDGRLCHEGLDLSSTHDVHNPTPYNRNISSPQRRPSARDRRPSDMSVAPPASHPGTDDQRLPVDPRDTLHVTSQDNGFSRDLNTEESSTFDDGGLAIDFGKAGSAKRGRKPSLMGRPT